MSDAIRFRDYSLAQAECELVGACLDYEGALRVALMTLPLHPFRSQYADELDVVFYTLAGWLAGGTYDGHGNRERMERGLSSVPQWHDMATSYWLDELVCVHGIFPEYVQALCAAISERNRLYDERLEAIEEYRDKNPLSNTEEPVTGAVKRPPQRPKGTTDVFRR